MSRYHDDYRDYQRPSSRHDVERRKSPAAVVEPLPYPPSEVPMREISPRPASPGYTTWPVEVRRPQPPPQQSGELLVPASRARPRSVPSPGAVDRYYNDKNYYYDDRAARRPRSHRRRHSNASSSSSSSSNSDRDDTPLGRAKEFVNENFSHSRAGLGVGVLGAVVGGLAAREANNATNRYLDRNDHHHERDETKESRNQILTTLFGAAVGAMGANAVEKRIESKRARDRQEQEEWERRWGRDSSYPAARATGKSGRGGVVHETREVTRRPRRSVSRNNEAERSRRRDSGGSGGGGSGGHGGGGGAGAAGDGDRYYHHHHHRRGGRVGRDAEDDPWDRRTRNGSGLEREVDPDARSWRDVEDWVYDDRKSGGGSPIDDFH